MSLKETWHTILNTEFSKTLELIKLIQNSLHKILSVTGAIEYYANNDVSIVTERIQFPCLFQNLINKIKKYLDKYLSGIQLTLTMLEAQKLLRSEVQAPS